MTHSDERKIWHLRRLDLFASLRAEEIEEMARLLDDHLVPAGTELLTDRYRDRVYLVKSGAVRLYEHIDGQPVTVALLGAGRLFGLSSTFGNHDPGLGARTLSDAYICFGTWAKLMDVLSSHPGVAARMLKGLAEQVFRADSWLTRLGRRGPRARLADLLVEIADEFGEPVDEGCRIPFRLTQLDLGRIIGVSRETVSRVMGDFAERGLITRTQGRLIIEDRAGLATIAADD